MSLFIWGRCKRSEDAEDAGRCQIDDNDYDDEDEDDAVQTTVRLGPYYFHTSNQYPQGFIIQKWVDSVI